MNFKKILNALLLGVLFLIVGVASASDNKQLLAEMQQRANEYKPCTEGRHTPEQRFECLIEVDKTHPLPAQQQQMRYEQRLDELRFLKVDKLVYECLVKLNLPKEKITRQIRDECYSAADKLIPKSARQEAQADKYSRDATDKKKVEITRITFLALAVLLILAIFIGFFNNIKWGGNALWASGGIWVSAVLSFQIYFLTLAKSSQQSLTNGEIFQGLLTWSLITLPGLLLLWGGHATRKDAKFAADVNAKDATFLDDVNAMSYSRHNLNICVDQEKQMVMANGISIPLADFSYKTYQKTKKVSYNTGGNQTVYGSGGAIGTVYIPGESGSYNKHVGDVVEIVKKGEVVCSALLALSSKSSFEALIGVLNNINSWRDNIVQKSNKAAAIDARTAAQKSLGILCDQAKLEKDFKNKSCWNSSGMLTEAIAVDRAGKAFAVYNKGANTWIGTLKGASAQIVGDKLELKVDDPAYREKHLTEHRFSLLEGEKREVLVEWEDRINLLAKTAV